MKYFVVLGSNPILSIAELAAFFKLHDRQLAHIGPADMAVIDMDRPIDCQAAIKKLGGAIKIGEILSVQKNFSLEPIYRIIEDCAESRRFEGKFNFGLSYYGKRRKDLFALGLSIKKKLIDNGLKCRLVTSKENTLSSVVVKQNKLVDGGIELIFFEWEKEIWIGRTSAVQDFKGLERRDYGRPARDDHSGMLPPKLAQIMINLAQIRSSRSALLDPFCGSGTILSEAMLLGYGRLYGSDISEKAVADTRKNMEWIKSVAWDQTEISEAGPEYDLRVMDVRELSKHIPPSSIAAIITEPYLGPQRGGMSLPEVKNQLKDLYDIALREFYQVLESQGRIVMVWPVFIMKGNMVRPGDFLDLDISRYEIINKLPSSLQNDNMQNISHRRTFIYGRLGQKVWREIVVLRKK